MLFCNLHCIYRYMYVRNVNGDGRKWEGYARGGCSCTSWLPMNLVCTMCIPVRLARWRLFCALPPEYLANTEVEVRECASAYASYDEQQVSACCVKEQLLGKGRAPATWMVYLRIASVRITTMPRTLFQSVLCGCRVFTHASP